MTIEDGLKKQSQVVITPSTQHPIQPTTTQNPIEAVGAVNDGKYNQIPVNQPEPGQKLWQPKHNKSPESSNTGGNSDACISLPLPADSSSKTAHTKINDKVGETVLAAPLNGAIESSDSTQKTVVSPPPENMTQQQSEKKLSSSHQSSQCAKPKECTDPQKHTEAATQGNRRKRPGPPSILPVMRRSHRMRKIEKEKQEREKLEKDRLEKEKKEEEEKKKDSNSKPTKTSKSTRKGHGSKPPIRKTKYIGLKNQGATCYINCLVQSLFHLPRVRELIDTLPETINPKNQQPPSTSHALQKVFRGLLTSPKYVSTRILTRALGFEDNDVNEQQDVHEYLGMVLSRLENEIEGTQASTTMQRLFKGKVQKLIQCTSIDYKTSDVEECSQLSLLVKGCKGLQESLHQYCRKEQLTGENRYRVEGKGLQDAAKEYQFLSLPPVLTLCLRRFEYNRETNAVSKIHQRFEFPTCIDFGEFLSNSDGTATTKGDEEENIGKKDKTTKNNVGKKDQTTKKDALTSPEQKPSAMELEKRGVEIGKRKGNKIPPSTAHLLPSEKGVGIDSTSAERQKEHRKEGEEGGERRKDDNRRKPEQNAESCEEVVKAAADDKPCLYLLHSIFVHLGSAQKGHYKVYIRPNPTLKLRNKRNSSACEKKDVKKRQKAGNGETSSLDVKDKKRKARQGGDEKKKNSHHQEGNRWIDGGKWYCFDDETVREVGMKEAVEGAFGPTPKVSKIEPQLSGNNGALVAASTNEINHQPLAQEDGQGRRLRRRQYLSASTATTAVADIKVKMEVSQRQNNIQKSSTTPMTEVAAGTTTIPTSSSSSLPLTAPAEMKKQSGDNIGTSTMIGASSLPTTNNEKLTTLPKSTAAAVAGGGGEQLTHALAPRPLVAPAISAAAGMHEEGREQADSKTAGTGRNNRRNGDGGGREERDQTGGGGGAPLCGVCRYPMRKDGHGPNGQKWKCVICRANAKRKREGEEALTHEESCLLAYPKRRKNGQQWVAGGTVGGVHNGAKGETKGSNEMKGKDKMSKTKGKKKSLEANSAATNSNANRKKKSPEVMLPEAKDLFVNENIGTCSKDSSRRKASLKIRFEREWSNLDKKTKNEYRNRLVRQLLDCRQLNKEQQTYLGAGIQDTTKFIVSSSDDTGSGSAQMGMLLNGNESLLKWGKSSFQVSSSPGRQVTTKRKRKEGDSNQWNPLMWKKKKATLKMLVQGDFEEYTKLRRILVEDYGYKVRGHYGLKVKWLKKKVAYFKRLAASIKKNEEEEEEEDAEQDKEEDKGKDEDRKGGGRGGNGKDDNNNNNNNRGNDNGDDTDHLHNHSISTKKKKEKKKKKKKKKNSSSSSSSSKDDAEDKDHYHPTDTTTSSHCASSSGTVAATAAASSSLTTLPPPPNSKNNSSSFGASGKQKRMRRRRRRRRMETKSGEGLQTLNHHRDEAAGTVTQKEAMASKRRKRINTDDDEDDDDDDDGTEEVDDEDEDSVDKTAGKQFASYVNNEIQFGSEDDRLKKAMQLSLEDERRKSRCENTRLGNGSSRGDDTSKGDASLIISKEKVSSVSSTVSPSDAGATGSVGKRRASKYSLNRSLKEANNIQILRDVRLNSKTVAEAMSADGNAHSSSNDHRRRLNQSAAETHKKAAAVLRRNKRSKTGSKQHSYDLKDGLIQCRQCQQTFLKLQSYSAHGCFRKAKDDKAATRKKHKNRNSNHKRSSS
eukprot:jgi/Bigna1/87919/estExt_fgenesh1_pg.C_260018